MRGRGVAQAAVAVIGLVAWVATAEAWSYKEAAKPYAGQSITILDEITPLQETMKTLVPEFVKETGINVDYQLLNHFEVISKGQADMLSGRGAYDGVMVHSPQMGLLLQADVVRPIEGAFEEWAPLVTRGQSDLLRLGASVRPFR